MMKFVLASRHKEDSTKERFFYEWSIIHVALMLTSPTVPKVFKRYVQHFGISGVTNDMLVHPLSDENWESFAEHLVESYEDVIESLRGQDYVQRMQPHRFGSHRFITALTSFETIYQREDFRSGGVKVLHFLKKKPEMSQAQFSRWFRESHAPLVRGLLRGHRPIRKYVQNTSLPLDPALFKGTLFEFGSVGLYAGIEEFWFESLDAISCLRQDAHLFDAIRSSEEAGVEFNGSIAMVVNERVVWDFVTPGETTPYPAILDPASLESRIDRQGYTGFDTPLDLRSQAAAKG
jgi:hypothetical protein